MDGFSWKRNGNEWKLEGDIGKNILFSNIKRHKSTIIGGYGNNQIKEGRLILMMYVSNGRAVETMFWIWQVGFGSVA